MKVDLIISWPKSMDYPLWRDYIVRRTGRFNKIIIVFTETSEGIDYSDGIIEHLKNASKKFLFIHSGPVDPNEDWRNRAINQALTYSTAPWVWFTEQDFFIYDDDAFWRTVEEQQDGHDVIGYHEGDRLHPACMLVRRSAIDKTRRDFGIVPGVLDHFGKFVLDLQDQGVCIFTLPYQGRRTPDQLFYHMNGLSHNLSLVQRGEKPVYKHEEFDRYLTISLMVKPLDIRWKTMVSNYLKSIR